MPSNHLIFCHPVLLPPSIFPSIRVFSNESVIHIIPKYWNFSFSISPSNEYSELISFRNDWFDLLAVQGTLKSLLKIIIYFWLCCIFLETGGLSLGAARAGATLQLCCAALLLRWLPLRSTGSRCGLSSCGTGAWWLRGTCKRTQKQQAQWGLLASSRKYLGFLQEICIDFPTPDAIVSQTCGTFLCPNLYTKICFPSFNDTLQ